MFSLLASFIIITTPFAAYSPNGTDIHYSHNKERVPGLLQTVSEYKAMRWTFSDTYVSTI